MATDGTRFVAGVFTSPAQADAAVQRLHRLGLTESDIEAGAPDPGRYRIEYQESEELGKGVTLGIAIGIPVGSVAAIGVLMLAVPGISIGPAIGLGLLIGGFWGIFFGGLGGMVPKVLAHAEEKPTYTISDRSSDVVVIVHDVERIEAARRALKQQGVRYFLTEAPALRSRQAPVLAAG